MAVCAIPMKDKESIRVDWNLFSADVEEEYSVTEKTMVFELQSEGARSEAVEREVARKLIWALQAVHNGILSMSQDIDLVETSSNLASIRLTDGNKIQVKTSQRSSILSARHHMSNMVKAAFELAGARVEVGEGYPGWKMNPESDILKIAVETYKALFGKEPKVFRNSSLIYSDEIGGLVASMGFKGMLTEGAKHVLGWKSPHYVYHCAYNPNLKILLRDFKLSDDISLRFSNSDWAEYPLFADKYINWIDVLPQEEQVINIFMELSALGMAQPLSSNILEFLKALPECARAKGITFSTPTEIVTKLKSVSQLDVPYPMSWVDEERDTSSWLGNVLQREAFNKLYSVAERVHLSDDRRIKQDWDYLQASNNFRFMTTKNTGIWLNRGIYDSPYDAFTNYMNILGDFIKRVNSLYPEDVDSEELNSLLTTIKNQGDEITELQKEVAKWQAKAEKETAAKKTAAKKAVVAKESVVKKEPAAKKSATKKTAESKKAVGRAKKTVTKKEE